MQMQKGTGLPKHKSYCGDWMHPAWTANFADLRARMVDFADHCDAAVWIGVLLDWIL
ncbi:MAG: hypothetical protein RR297_00815 [Clostridia bacterium]